MYPVTAVLIAMLMLFGGGLVWATMLLRSFLDRRSPRVEGADGSGLEDVRDDFKQIEARLSQLEDEVDFFRKLHEPVSKEMLPPGLEPDA